MTKFLKKLKKIYFGVILDAFSQNAGKNEFSRKKGLFQFVNIPIIYHHTKKNQKKTYDPLLSKIPNWQTYWQTDRRTMVILYDPP